MASPSARRVRPSDSSWPNAESWEKLKQDVGGNLVKVESPLVACESASDSASCQEVIKNLRNPYFIGDQAGGTQTSGWVDAWTSAPSVYAVAARNAADVVAAVNFARENNLRLVVKGGGHSYQGTSNAADSLLIWTRAMNNSLFNPDWGEIVAFRPDNTLAISMVFQGFDKQQAEKVWQPFFDWVRGSPVGLTIESAPTIVSLPARNFWNAEDLGKKAPGMVFTDDRPGAADTHM